MKNLLTALLIAVNLTAIAQTYTFPNIEKTKAAQVKALADSLFAGISKGHVSTDIITGPQKELTREMLEYLKNRIGNQQEFINCYPLDSTFYRAQIACTAGDTLRVLFTLDISFVNDNVTLDFPLWHDTRNWAVKQVGTMRYHYDHDFDLKAAQAFDAANHRIAQKLNLPVESFDFYLSDNYQHIMQWLGLSYDRLSAGQYRDGFNIEQTIFATQHNEDFSHDLVHYYVWKVRKGPRNGFAEEGVAYYWGNAYYPDAGGKMIDLARLKKELRVYLAAHPGIDLLTPFRQNQRGIFGPVKEISMRSTLSGIIAEYVEQKYGTDGILQLLNCGAGETSFFTVADKLAGINTGNFNTRIRELLGK